MKRLAKIVTNSSRLILACFWTVLGQSQTAPNVGKVEVELVTLRDGGFYPSTITRSAGKFLLIVKNRSHSHQVQYGVTRSDAAVVAPVETVIAISRDYILDLPAGTYLLRESSHPNWTPLTVVTH